MFEDVVVSSHNNVHACQPAGAKKLGLGDSRLAMSPQTNTSHNSRHRFRRQQLLNINPRLLRLELVCSECGVGIESISRALQILAANASVCFRHCGIVAISMLYLDHKASRRSPKMVTQE